MKNKGLVKDCIIYKQYFDDEKCFVGQDPARPEYGLIVENVVIMSKKRYAELLAVESKAND
jgi:hypothetical protein